MKPLRIVIHGAGGRMGQTLARVIAGCDEARVVAGVDPRTTAEALEACGFPAGAPVVRTLEEAPPHDLLIDFSVAAAVSLAARHCAQAGVALVSGTTGLGASERAALVEAARSVAVLAAPNMSVGVNLLFALAHQLGVALGGGWDLEVSEIHHRRKVDAPSGTAARLLEILAAARGADRAPEVRHGRHGLVGPRSESEIGAHALRGGDVVGEHTVFAFGEGERLELTHRATDRAIFARGALRAALWLRGRPAGLYGMADVLGIEAPPALTE